MTLEEATDYVNHVRWQYAKTYATAPHEYTCLSWKPEWHSKMVDFAYFVKINGYIEIFGKKAFRVFKIGDYKYWTMDDPWDNTDLINRTFVDDEKRKEITAFALSSDFMYITGMSLEDVYNQMEMKNQQKPKGFGNPELAEHFKNSDLFGGQY